MEKYPLGEDFLKSERESLKKVITTCVAIH